MLLISLTVLFSGLYRVPGMPPKENLYGLLMRDFFFGGGGGWMPLPFASVKILNVPYTV